MDYVSFITNHRSPLLRGLESSLPCLRQGLWQTERGRKVNRKQNGVLSSCPDSRWGEERWRQARSRRLGGSSFNDKVVSKSSENESNNHGPNFHLICIKCILMRLICMLFVATCDGWVEWCVIYQRWTIAHLSTHTRMWMDHGQPSSKIRLCVPCSSLSPHMTPMTVCLQAIASVISSLTLHAHANVFIISTWMVLLKVSVTGRECRQ